MDETDILGLEENSLRNSFRDLVELFCKLNKIIFTPATFFLEHYIADVITLEKYSNEPGSKERIALLQNISEVVKKTPMKNIVFSTIYVKPSRYHHLRQAKKAVKKALVNDVRGTAFHFS